MFHTRGPFRREDVVPGIEEEIPGDRRVVNEGELATSTTISVPSIASGSPSPVTVLTPVEGEAAIT